MNYRTNAAPPIIEEPPKKKWRVEKFTGRGTGPYASPCGTCGGVYKRSKICTGRRGWFSSERQCPASVHFHCACDCGAPSWLEATLQNPDGGDWE